MKRDKIFFSYHEVSKKSQEIVTELREFFDSWAIGTVVVAWDEEIEVPKHKIYKGVLSSAYLIQIITDRPGPSEWMKEEWSCAKNDREIKGLILLYTSEAYIHPAFNQIKDEIKNGTIMGINIEEQDLRPTLKGILKSLQHLKKVGNIICPDWRKGIKAKNEIGISQVSVFIENFYEANKQGLDTVYPHREAALEDLKSRFKKVKKNEEVRLLGFTLCRYVHPKHNTGFGREFEKAIHSGARAKLLMLNPDCPAAKERSAIEDPNVDHECSLLVTDNLKVQKQWKDHQNIEFKFYETPYVGMVLFDDEVYIELYHLGKDISDRNICGHVPIFKMRGNSNFYALFESHFTTVWNSR